MIPKTVIARIVEKQGKLLEERTGALPRALLSEMPYLSDQALLLGGVRGSGRSTLLLQMMRSEYPQAWYTHFEDPRLAGFDGGDFAKLAALITESGRGVVLLDKVDGAAEWMPFVEGLLDRGIKVVATVSLDTFLELQQAQRRGQGDPQEGNPGRQGMPGRRPGYRKGKATTGSSETAGPDTAAAQRRARLDASYRRYLLRRVPLFTYPEFLDAARRWGFHPSVQDYLLRGAFPEQQKNSRPETLYDLYETILARDVLLARGVRDQVTLRRIALRLLSAGGRAVTANSICKELKIKSVSTVVEHMGHLERAGLVSYVPLWSENPARRHVNPRKAYPIDTALEAALTLEKAAPRGAAFETMLYHHLTSRYERLFYTDEEGGCDFVALEEGRPALCVQACYEEEDPDGMQRKAEGLARALTLTGAPRGMIVTPSTADRIFCGEHELEITDADTFLTER